MSSLFLSVHSHSSLHWRQALFPHSRLPLLIRMEYGHGNRVAPRLVEKCIEHFVGPFVHSLKATLFRKCGECLLGDNHFSRRHAPPPPPPLRRPPLFRVAVLIFSSTTGSNSSCNVWGLSLLLLLSGSCSGGSPCRCCNCR